MQPPKILAEKNLPTGTKVLVILDGKKVWVWKDKLPKPKPDNWEQFLSQ